LSEERSSRGERPDARNISLALRARAIPYAGKAGGGASISDIVKRKRIRSKGRGRGKRRGPRGPFKAGSFVVDLESQPVAGLA